MEKIMINKKNQTKINNQHYAEIKKQLIDLSLSENPLGCSPMVHEAIKNCHLHVSSYPDPHGQKLKCALAKDNKLQPQNFFISNGSESIIFHLPKIISNQQPCIIIPKLTFPLLKQAARLHHKKIMNISMTLNYESDLEAIQSSITHRTGMIYICNPNNPTGEVISQKKLISFVHSIPSHIIIVIDEANIEFGGISLINQISHTPNLIILRTFSKAYGLAGIRVGFAAASEILIQKLEEISQPFPISNMSQMLAITALKDRAFLSHTKKFISIERRILVSRLSQMGFDIFPSKTNNLFVKIPSEISETEFVNHLKHSKISVILGENFDGFDNKFFRLSIKDQKTNRLFLNAMKLLCY
jgi:histidinol-phosphate aminotransferase